MLLNKLSIKHIIKKPKILNKYPAPLFLMIHGYGSNENDLFSFQKDIPENFFIISIQGCYSFGLDKYSWYDIDFSNKDRFINIDQAKKTIEKISFFIDEAIKEYKLNQSQVWLCGFSQGAILSYAIAFKKPEKVKKVIALSGYLEKKLLPKNMNSSYIDLKFFISHGKYDTICPINLVKKGINFLKNKKILSLQYKEYESGHSLNSYNYQDIINWIKKNQSF
ncbi:alpha/beta hydrolase [Blattabacterium punctulatus]|uniref:alpha/beta hydrolase n=1 Tax=Blattabacterium punctulatus TaxID=164514 RepID=UPI000D7C26B1|nr:phospholipase [Blattabacterium punctulatus]AWU44514.1 phospholipase [Blattabacterium punctulatus]AWU45599.1 phospholipase [Blattabacterium punctulatus]